MASGHSQPAKVAIVSMSVQSINGQEALRWIHHLGLEDCALVDLRPSFPMPDDELAAIARPNLGGLEASLDIERLVYRHAAFPCNVYSCIENSVDGTHKQGLQLYFRVDDGGGLADVVCRAEVEMLRKLKVEQHGDMTPAFECQYIALGPNLDYTTVGPILSSIVDWLGTTDVDHRLNVEGGFSYSFLLGLIKVKGQDGLSDEQVEHWNDMSAACRDNRASLIALVDYTECKIIDVVLRRASIGEPQRIRFIDRRIDQAIPNSDVETNTIGEWTRSGEGRPNTDQPWFREARRLGLADLYTAGPQELVPRAVSRHRLETLVVHEDDPDVAITYEHPGPLHSSYGQTMPGRPSSLPGPDVIRPRPRQAALPDVVRPGARPAAPTVIRADSVSGDRSGGLPDGARSIIDESRDSRASPSDHVPASSDVRLTHQVSRYELPDPHADPAPPADPHGKGAGKAAADPPARPSGKGQDTPGDLWASWSPSTSHSTYRTHSWTSSSWSSSHPWQNEPLQRDVLTRPSTNAHPEPPLCEEWACCPHGNRCPNVEMWRNTLYQKFRCDEVALQQLVNLSHFSPAGHREANKLIDKMLKMLHTGRASQIINPSAFVSTAVEKARQLLTPEGEYYKGMGWSSGGNW